MEARRQGTHEIDWNVNKQTRVSLPCVTSQLCYHFGHKYLLSTCNVQGSILGPEELAINR